MPLIRRIDGPLRDGIGRGEKLHALEGKHTDSCRYADGLAQKAPRGQLLSEPCSLSLEFTRLAQHTGDDRYYDAVQRVADHLYRAQNYTRLPGMWPVTIDPSLPSFDTDDLFTLGGMSDSTYEYLPKQYLLLKGLLHQPRAMYENFIEVAKKHLFFRVLNPDNLRIRLSGDVRMVESATRGLFEPTMVSRSQHLACFAGGMVALASRIFDRPEDLTFAEELTHGCIWAYNASAHGVAPELFDVAACAPQDAECLWSEAKWHAAVVGKDKELQAAVKAADGHIVQDPGALDDRRTLLDTSTDEPISTSAAEALIAQHRLPRGFTRIRDARYILRPEAIESVFLLHRITGKREYAEAAWAMFQAVERLTRTDLGASALADVSVPSAQLQHLDSMESFWLAETLKYFYLCFEDARVLSLDEWVFNTEAHPLRW